MKVKFTGKNKDLKFLQYYDIDFVANTKGVDVSVGGYGEMHYDNLTDFALDWHIIEKRYSYNVLEEYLEIMARLP